MPAAVGAIWGLVKTIEKVVNFRLNRKKLQGEVKKLELENARSSHVAKDESPEDLNSSANDFPRADTEFVIVRWPRRTCAGLR